MIRVGVIGHRGRMGSESCRAIDGDPDLELVAKVGRGDDLAALTQTGTEVAVEFSTPQSVRGNVRFCIDNGVHAVVGATGLDAAALQEIRESLKEGGANVFVAPNFALGAVLMMSFARQAARYYDAAEIVERHHDKKLDAPSGTALRTARMMTDAAGGPMVRPPGTESVTGSRGGDAGGVRVHSLRLPGSVAHQEVVFGGTGETLTIRHDSLDRASFMPGLILAIKEVGKRPGLTVGLEHLLDL